MKKDRSTGAEEYRAGRSIGKGDMYDAKKDTRCAAATAAANAKPKKELVRVVRAPGRHRVAGPDGQESRARRRTCVRRAACLAKARKARAHRSGRWR